jgi:hypothetical protein
MRSLQLPEENIQHIKTLNFIIFLWVLSVFFLDPDADSQSRSKSPIDYGSNPVLDPKRWSRLRTKVFIAISRTTKYGPEDDRITSVLYKLRYPKL